VYCEFEFEDRRQRKKKRKKKSPLPKRKRKRKTQKQKEENSTKQEPIREFQPKVHPSRSILVVPNLILLGKYPIKYMLVASKTEMLEGFAEERSTYKNAPQALLLLILLHLLV
jgi:hypothetical protein